MPRISPWRSVKEMSRDMRARQRADIEHDRLADLAGARRIGVGDVAAGHQPDDLPLVGIGDGAGRHGAAVAHDGDAVADAHHLVHAVRDVEDGAAAKRAVRRSRANSRSDSSPVRAAVGSSMTKIEAALPPPLTSVLAMRTSIWSPVLSRAIFLCGSMSGICSRASASRAPRLIDFQSTRAPKPPRIGLAEEDVLRHRQLRNDVQLLVDEAQPVREGGLRAVEPDLDAVDRDRRAVGRDDAGEDLDQRRSCRRRSRPSGREPRRPASSSDASTSAGTPE